MDQDTNRDMRQVKDLGMALDTNQDMDQDTDQVIDLGMDLDMDQDMDFHHGYGFLHHSLDMAEGSNNIKDAEIV